MYYINLSLRYNFKISQIWFFKKEISTKEFLFWHTSELHTTVTSEYVIRWSRNENHPWSTAVLCVKNAWICSSSPPYILMASCLSDQLSPVPVTVQVTAAERLKTVRLDMAQKPLVLPVIFDPRSCSHRVPLPHHTVSPSCQYDTASYVVRG